MSGLRRRVGRRVFSERPFALICGLIGPAASGRLAARFIEPGGGAELPACLCVDRDVFRKDIVQLRARASRSWPSISQQLLYLCEQTWLPRSYFNQTAFQQALPDLSPQAVAKVDRFAESFLRAAAREHGTAAILTGNVDYAPDEFLRRAARRLGIPFLVLLKEHAMTGYGRRNFARSLEGYRYHGDAVAVFGSRTERILVEEGVCELDRITITGPPRLDEWIDLTPAPERDVAVLFAFSRDDQEGSSTFPQVVEAFAAAAAAAPPATRRFVVKCRDPYEEATVRGLVTGEAAERLELTSTEPVPELLRRANAVVGYSSLAMVEGLLSWGTVISPRFGTCRNDQDAQFDDGDPQLAALVRFVPSAEELTRAVLDAAGASIPETERAARRGVVSELFCAPNPTYSAAVDRFVRRALDG